jgi:hypothetical protein
VTFEPGKLTTTPIIEPGGKVIGIVSGGNTTVFKDTKDSVNAKVRVPNDGAHQFAQRIDLLNDLAQGVAARRLS